MHLFYPHPIFGGAWPSNLEVRRVIEVLPGLSLSHSFISFPIHPPFNSILMEL